MNSEIDILIRHHAIRLPPPSEDTALGRDVLATVMANLAYYGYALPHAGVEALARCARTDVEAWWSEVEVVLAKITGDAIAWGDFVVYKNFPREVLEMSEAEYWFKQILLYWGLPHEALSEAEQARAPLDEPLELPVLQVADDSSLTRIYSSLVRLPARWTSEQLSDACTLAAWSREPFVLSTVAFKENMVALAKFFLEAGLTAHVTTATDVLRLAVGLSDGDVSLRQPCKLRGFSRKQRRFLLAMLDSATHLEADVQRRPERFKRLFHALRPGDYRRHFGRVCVVYDKLYRGQLAPSFNAEVELALAAGNRRALGLLQQRPGEFARRLRSCLRRFDLDAAEAFAKVVPKLSGIQLLRTLRFLQTVNSREHRLFPPRGNWTRVRMVAADVRYRVSSDAVGICCAAIEAELGARLETIAPTVRLDPRTRYVKLQTNDSELTPYGRGTCFPIPERIRFIRTAAYWKSGPTRSNIWYDNSWNFFAADWSVMGACCWNAVAYKGAAIFAGDPTNSNELEGRACQLIDLYLDELREAGVRYAVWSVLCYSRISFAEAEEVFASLQWGEEPQTGNLFEPARCQLSFPITGRNLTKFIAYLDLDERLLVYIDANLRGRVDSAERNGASLAKRMPAFCEYLETLPSVYDLFAQRPIAEQGLAVLYSDADVSLAPGELAYVFQPENPANTFECLDLASLL